jgi:hypothetical protein
VRFWQTSRTVGALAVATFFAATLALSGCATGGKGHHSDDTHVVTIEVYNNITVPTVITVWIQGQNAGRRMLGTVPGADSAKFVFKPDRWGTYYHLIAERQLQRPVTSNRFNFGGPSTGTILWQLVPNIVTTYELQIDTVAH